MDEFLCKICNYKTRRKGNYEKHLISKKHLSRVEKLMNGEALASKELFCEVCNYKTTKKGDLQKHFKTQKHKKNMKQLESQSVSNQQCEVGGGTLEQLSKNDLLEIIKDLIPKVNTNNTVNNSNTVNNNTINNTNNINIQVFLDDKCKNAMTIQNFITQMTLSIEDLLEHKNNRVSSGSFKSLLNNEL